MQVDQLFNHYGSLGFEVQRHLASELERATNSLVDLQEGTIDLGDAGRWSVEVIGSASGGTWLWGWANEASQLPPAAVEHVTRLRDGMDGVTAMTTPQPSLDEHVQPHRLCLLATHFVGFKGYLGLPNGPGEVFLGITDPTFPVDPRPALHRFVMTVPPFVADFDVPDHRTLVETHARNRGLAVADGDERSLQFAGPAGEATFTFDEHDRLTDLSSKLRTPEQASPPPGAEPAPRKGLLSRLRSRRDR